MCIKRTVSNSASGLFWSGPRAIGPRDPRNNIATASQWYRRRDFVYLRVGPCTNTVRVCARAVVGHPARGHTRRPPTWRGRSDAARLRYRTRSD